MVEGRRMDPKIGAISCALYPMVAGLLLRRGLSWPVFVALKTGVKIRVVF